ncbi:MAG: cytochrome c3 family protein [Desulfocapsaceae bacterium]
MSGKNQGRQNWTLSMTVAVITAVAAAVFGSIVTNEPAAKDRFYLENTAGSVLFDHTKHAEAADSCAACHHDLYGSMQVTSCEECHDDEVEPVDFEHAELKEYHGRECSTCHEQVADDDRAASCRSCHPDTQDEEARTVDCSQCHDDDYDLDMMEHDELLEIEDHSCLGCHAPGSLAEVYHTNCTSCHLEAAAKRFANGDGTVNCSACHLR